MSVRALVPVNTSKAKNTAVNAFIRFVKEEGLTIDLVHETLRANPSGQVLESVLDKFGVYLAYRDSSSGSKSKISRNSVMSYFRHVKLWLVDMHRQGQEIEKRLHKMGKTLDSFCLKRTDGGKVKKSPVLYKTNFSTAG